MRIEVEIPEDMRLSNLSYYGPKTKEPLTGFLVHLASVSSLHWTGAWGATPQEAVDKCAEEVRRMKTSHEAYAAAHPPASKSSPLLLTLDDLTF